MSGSEIIASFSQDVVQALTKALDAKGKELDSREQKLDDREKKIKEREDNLDRIFTNHCGKQRVTVQVGNTCFDTTYDILLSCPDSYFHAFQCTEKKKILEQPPETVFIPRNPASFGYVLEYLTYGELYSELSDKGLLNILLADAKFYGLPGLAKSVESYLASSQEKNQDINKALKDMESKVALLSGTISARNLPLYLKAAAQGSFSNGQWINWNSQTVPLASHLQYDGASTYTVLKRCLIQLTIRYTATCSTNGNGAANVNLLVNGVAVARCYHGQSVGYQESREMQDLREYNANDRIQFQYYSNSNTVNDVLGTTLTMIVLHTF